MDAEQALVLNKKMDIIEINHLLIYSKYVNKLRTKNQYKLYNEYCLFLGGLA